MQITNNLNGSGIKVNLIKGVSSEAIAEGLIRINEQELNIIGYESQTKTYRDETSVLRDNTQVSANNANVSATNANNSALLSTAKANEAILSANNALTYRNEAETFKTNAKVSEINADLRATAASTSEVNAKSSELLALQYKDTTLSLKDETLLLKNETVSNAITATEQATISTSNAIIAEQQAQIATTKASESLVNANNAKASELLSAQYKADNENIKTNVQTLSNSAYDSANTASIKANEAIDSAIISTTQANISIAKASEASTYATNSNTSAINALASENKAEEWASKEYGLEVEPGLYSAKHYAITTQNTLNTKVDTTTNQTISGVKTFTSTPKIGTDNITSISTSVTDNAIARYDGTTGKLQNSSVVIDDNGNVGIGVTPSAWGAINKVIDIGNMSYSGRVDGGSTGASIAQNSYRDTSDVWRYKQSAYASRIEICNGAYYWFTAPSGTAGNAITWTNAMTLASSGNLLVGTTTDNGVDKLQVNGSITSKSSGYKYSNLNNACTVNENTIVDNTCLNIPINDYGYVSIIVSAPYIYCMQTFIALNTPVRMFIRVLAGGNWSAWAEK